MYPKATPTHYHFLAIVSPEREAYVVRTASQDFRKVYKSHWQGDHVETAALFHSGRPGLFLLETVDVSSEKAFGRCIQWSRLFHECDYTVTNWSDILPYVEHPHPDDWAVYKRLRRYNLKKICRPECDLAADFMYKASPHTIKLVVTLEEWQELRRDAADKGVPIDVYCRRRFFDGTVSTLTLSELRSCEQLCRQVVSLLERETRYALLQGQAGPAVDRLQALTEDLRIEVRGVTEAIRHHMEVMR